MMTIAKRSIPYRDRGVAFNGLLAWDQTRGRQLPGILLIHGGAGLDDHARAQAERYARLGYAVFACDMYGEGVVGNRERVMASVTSLRDNPDLLAQRGMAGLEALSACAEVGSPVAVIGFCFGGMAALRLAREGVDIGGAISVHGSLQTARPAEHDSIKAKVLACHGALDPHVPFADVTAFVEEMNRVHADWQLIVHGGAMHGFTHEHATLGAQPGVAYDAAADRRSFAAIGAFLSELHQPGPDN